MRARGMTIGRMRGHRSPLAAPPPPPTGGNTYNVPGGIDATGATDVTNALLAWIATIPDGAPDAPNVVLFPAGARYNIEGTLYIANRNWLTFDGGDTPGDGDGGAEFFALTLGTGATPLPVDNSAIRWPRDRAQWVARGGSNLTWTGMRVTGMNPDAGATAAAYKTAYEEQASFHIRGVANTKILHCTATDPYGDFVTIVGSSSTVPSVGSEVAYNQFTRCGRQGIAPCNCTDVEIHHNSISEVGRSIFDCEPPSDTNVCLRINMHHNDVGTAGTGVLLAGLGADGCLWEDISLTDNICTGKEMDVQVSGPYAPGGYRRRGLTIARNVSNKIFGSPVALVKLKFVVDVEITDNVSPVQALGGPYSGTAVANLQNPGDDYAPWTVAGNNWAPAANDSSSVLHYFPVAPPPPSMKTPVVGTGTAECKWSIPSGNGGHAIDGYRWEMRRASDDVLLDSGPSAGINVAGRTTGVRSAASGVGVTFRVASHNDIGWGAWSANSTTVVPT